MRDTDLLLALLGTGASKFEKSAALTINKVWGKEAALKFILTVKKMNERQLPILLGRVSDQAQSKGRPGKILYMQNR